MKKIFFSLVFIVSFCNINAQTNTLEYLSSIADIDGIPVANKDISIQIKVLQGTASGNEVYSEVHNLETGPGGQVILDIGGGSNASTAFDNVDWSYPNFVEMLIDLDGGSNYTSYKKTELLTVPYAIFALNIDCQRNCVPEDGVFGETGLQGPQGFMGPQGPSGLSGIDGSPGRTGDTGLTGAEHLKATDLEPTGPSSGFFYIDDGTNRSDGNVGIRYYDGTKWLDL